MFHVSFLVKQRVVKLSVDDEIGLPVLEPVSSRHADDADGEAQKNQAIISYPASFSLKKYISSEID